MTRNSITLHEQLKQSNVYYTGKKKKNNQANNHPLDKEMFPQAFLKVCGVSLGFCLQERLSKKQLLLNMVNKVEEHFPCTRICYDKFDL